MRNRTRHPLSSSTRQAIFHRSTWGAVALTAVLFGQAAAQSPQQGASDSYVPGRILVMPRAGMSDLAFEKIVKDNGAHRGRRVGRSELRIVELPRGLERETVARLSRHPHVKFAELDQLIPPNVVPNDPYLGSQWHIEKIRATTAWDTSLGNGVTIAILDSGVDAAHPDLSARLVAGWNWFDNNSDTADVYGHGTKVAGAAAASSDNSLGIAGVAGRARIMPIRVSNLSGYASLSALSQGLTWAADHGARIANISYVVANSQSVINAANYLKSKGGLVVTSAGNYGTDVGIAPTTSMIAVSATDGDDAKTSWSSFGAFVGVAAPGAGIYTTVAGGGYGAVSGTSFSSPITGGVIALMMAANPALTPAQVESLLFSTALDLGLPGRDIYFGYGRIDAGAAVAAAKAAIAQVDTIKPTVAILAPLGASTVSGLVPVDVSATDNVGISKVELRVNGALVASDSVAPFAFSWDSTTANNGGSTLVATAVDTSGNVSISKGVAVSVANSVTPDTTPPVVSVTHPVNGTVVSGTVQVRVVGSDNSGAAGLRQSLYINGALVASGTGASLNHSWNTRKDRVSRFTLRAVAQDAAGNQTSTSVTVTR